MDSNEKLDTLGHAAHSTRNKLERAEDRIEELERQVGVLREDLSEARESDEGDDGGGQEEEPEPRSYGEMDADEKVEFLERKYGGGTAA